MEENDPNKLRNVEIRRLADMTELAYKNATDPEVKMKTREAWFGKYTNAVLALNQLLKDAQYREHGQRLQAIEEFARENN